MNQVQVHLPEMVDILRGETVVLGLPKESGVRYTWTVKGENSIGDTLRFLPTENTVVHVVKGLGSCLDRDSAQIFL